MFCYIILILVALNVLQLTKELQVAAVDDFLGLVRCKSGRKINIQSMGKIVTIMLPDNVKRRLTSDKDRTGDFTQSSQHFDKSVNKTRGGGTLKTSYSYQSDQFKIYQSNYPSHLVRSCN